MSDSEREIIFVSNHIEEEDKKNVTMMTMLNDGRTAEGRKINVKNL